MPRHKEVGLFRPNCSGHHKWNAHPEAIYFHSFCTFTKSTHYPFNQSFLWLFKFWNCYTKMLLTYPTIPWEIFLGSRLSSRPRPLIWLCAPILSILVMSLTSWTLEWIPEFDIFYFPFSENVLENLFELKTSIILNLLKSAGTNQFKCSRFSRSNRWPQQLNICIFKLLLAR